MPRASLNGYASQKALVMAHYSSSSPSKKTQTVKFRATFQTEEIKLVVKISRNHQQKIELSINNLQKKQRNITQNYTVLLVLVLLQTKDLKCATHLLSEKFRNMSEEKKAIVRNLGFGGLMHIPPLRVHHQILKELANSFKLGKNTLEIGYGSFKVRPRTIGVALGINASGDLLPHKVNYKDLSEDNKQIFRRFQVKTLKNLTDEMMAIGVDNEQDRLMFKRIFILYIQMAFLLPTTIKKISPCAPGTNFQDGHNNRGELGSTYYNLKKKKAIDGCLFALMIVYFHLSKNKDKKGGERPPEPWIANWTREQFVERMRAEMEEHMCILPLSLRLKRTQRIQQGNNPPEKSKSKTQSKKKKVIVENSSPEQAQSYHGYSTL
ncbi:hypothetical protein Ahy_B06g081315 [Arachis hypogaea]|uniref:Uncharacterized protein n=1 Tax=Arachis hypogaea TaxID=3818 RepID=A0A444YKZ6_ARAHY|nr:hypothetical protein Ahy_B06g081315 [Arachis hypogaea]